MNDNYNNEQFYKMESVKSEELERKRLAHLVSTNVYVLEPRTSLETINSGRITFLTFGTGFFIKHRERFFFVTADHVARYSYWEEGIDVECNTIMIPHNDSFQNKGSLGCGFSIKSSWVSYDENKELYGMEFFPIDVSFCEITPDDLLNAFFTQELILDNVLVCKEGECHYTIEEFDSVPFNKDKQYFFGGISECVQVGPGIKSQFNYLGGLSYESIDSDGNVILSGQEINKDKLGGLSGAPIFDYDGMISGMFVRASENDNSITAVPIDAIFRYVNYYIDANPFDDNTNMQTNPRT